MTLPIIFNGERYHVEGRVLDGSFRVTTLRSYHGDDVTGFIDAVFSLRQEISRIATLEYQREYREELNDRQE